MEQHQSWQALGSGAETQAPSIEPTWDISRNTSGTAPLATNGEHYNGQRTSHTNTNRTQAPLSCPPDVLSISPMLIVTAAELEAERVCNSNF